MVFRGSSGEARSLALNSSGSTLAVGYSDGHITLWNTETGEEISTYTGHKKSVSCLTFDGEDALLASGSRDTDVVVWDLVKDAGAFK